MIVCGPRSIAIATHYNTVYLQWILEIWEWCNGPIEYRNVHFEQWLWMSDWQHTCACILKSVAIILLSYIHAVLPWKEPLNDMTLTLGHPGDWRGERGREERWGGERGGKGGREGWRGRQERWGGERGEVRGRERGGRERDGGGERGERWGEDPDLSADTHLIKGSRRLHLFQCHSTSLSYFVLVWNKQWTLYSRLFITYHVPHEGKF